MRNRGFTLLESIIVMLIIGILFGLSIPVFEKHHRLDLTPISKRLKQDLEFAKSVAASQQTTVTVCGSSDAMNCDQQWSRGYMIFLDKTGKGVRAEGQPLLAVQRYESESLRIQWKGFLSESLIQFSPGMAQGQNGTLTLSDGLGHQQKLLINSLGRIRMG